MKSFGRLLGRTLVIVTMKFAVVGAIIFINNVTAPVERGEFHECFNPHTAQIFIEDDARCLENPYDLKESS